MLFTWLQDLSLRPQRGFVAPSWIQKPPEHIGMVVPLLHIEKKRYLQRGGEFLSIEENIKVKLAAHHSTILRLVTVSDSAFRSFRPRSNRVEQDKEKSEGRHELHVFVCYCRE